MDGFGTKWPLNVDGPSHKETKLYFNNQND